MDGREFKHDPRHRYDCGRCKFNWNCGILCSCVLSDAYGSPPKSRAKEVEEAHIQWLTRRTAIETLERTASYLSDLANGTLNDGLPPDLRKSAEDLIAPLDNLADGIGRFRHPEEDRDDDQR